MAAGDLDAPKIPLLINNTIDPEALNGGPLLTYAKYTNPQLGDALYQSWLGLTADGDPVDYKGGKIDVDPQQGQTEFPMPVPYDTVWLLNQGQVFYSYFLDRVTGEDREESKRIHFGIGKHGLLSAPQIKESHDLQLDPDAIENNQITIAAVPFTAMSNGDQVRVVWKGEYGDGTAGPPVNLPVKTLCDTDTDPTNNPGQVLSWTARKIDVVPLRGGKITLHYEITYASSALSDTFSAERTFLVASPAAPELPVASVRDLIGDEINPVLFPSGIRVVIPVYPGIRVGDDVLVYGTRIGSGSGPNKNTIQYLKIDLSNIESGRIEVPIDRQWLLDNSGGDVNLRYQYARPDAAGSSALLALSIREPLVLPTPTVDSSVAPGGRDELDPVRASRGAYIAIPEAATISDGDEVTAYWKGFGDTGSYETKDPSHLDPIMKFRVPPEVLPPNIGKTVEVVYQVAGQDSEPPLKLYIRPLGSHPYIDCEKIETGSPATLKLSVIPPEGVGVSVGLWSFISTEHEVRLWLTFGSTSRDIIPVRKVEFEETTEGVKAKLLKTDLADIAINDTFTLRASVSFDGGHSTFPFNNPLSLKLLA